MSTTMYKSLALAVGMTAMVAFAGCSDYVKKSDLSAAIAQLQSKDQNLQQQINTLSQDMKSQFAQYDSKISAMAGRISIDSVAHFAYNEATLQDQDKAKLDSFASVMKAHHSDALVTVEGFTDPDGSSAFNKKLGMQRAEAVRDYLVNTAGMAASQVRAVSYGEQKARQVVPGAKGPGDTGADNRRATLVIDLASANS